MPTTTAEAAARAATPQSLRTRLLWRVLLPLAATWSVGNAVAFTLSWTLAGRAFDRALLDDAYAIAANVVEARRRARPQPDAARARQRSLRSAKRRNTSPSRPPTAASSPAAATCAPQRRAPADSERVLRRQCVTASRCGSRACAASRRGRSWSSSARRRTARQNLLLGLLAAIGRCRRRSWCCCSARTCAGRSAASCAPLVDLQRELDRRDSSELEPIAFAAPI